MEPCPSTTQDGKDLTEAMYQLFGGEQQRGFSVLQQAMVSKGFFRVLSCCRLCISCQS